MLSQMRKHAGSWMIKVLLFAIVVVFSFWGVGSFRNREDTHVAEVNGEIISFELFRRTYNNMLDQYRSVNSGQLDDKMLKMLNLPRRAIDQLVDRALLRQEAERLQIDVSNTEVVDAVRSYPAFQVGGAFNKDRYESLLGQIRMSPQEFENDQRESLQLQKLQALVMDSVVVSDDEARAWYQWYNAEVDLDFVLFKPGDYKDISPEAERIKAFFDAHQEEYKTDPSVKVSYLFFDPERYRKTIQVDDEQIAQYYESHIEEFTTEKTVQARHILLKLDEDADEETVAARKEKALEIYKMATEGQDFAELAKKYSEGPSRDKGGDLGAFKKGAMVAPFGDKAFSMKAGEISEPVRTKFGWHIIKVEKINEGGTQSLDEVKDRIRKKLVDQQARDKALAHAEEVYYNVFDSDRLTDAGKKYDVPVVTTDFFNRASAPLKGVGNQRQFIDAAFGLEKQGISEILELGKGCYLLQVEDQKPAAVPTFETVAEKVKQDFVKSLQDEKAKADAEALLAAVQGGEKFEKAAKKYNLEVTSTGYFKRTGSVPKIGYDRGITEQAFLLTSEKALCEKPLSGAKGWFVIRLKDRKKPADEGFDKEQTTIVSQLTQQKKQRVYQQWLTDVKARSDIDIKDELIK